MVRCEWYVGVDSLVGTRRPSRVGIRFEAFHQISPMVLGALAQLDWEREHLQMEKRMGLGLFDLSGSVFDQVITEPETDPGMLAAFLNASLSAFGAATGQTTKPKLPSRFAS